jgi:membrane protease YdiL (CAAX protease family)
MNWIQSVLAQLSQWVQPYYTEIALTILATILVVYGDVFNKHIKRMISPYHFVIRTLVFVLICAFGYGLLVVFATPYVKQLIMWVPYLYRGLTVIFVFLLLGYLAENRRYI